jgi:hypothetical protein
MSKWEFSNTKGYKMVVTSLEKMEEIVSNNKALSWNGWTVVHSYASDKARTSKFGALVHGKWQMQKHFVPTSIGWEIPDKFVR